MSALFSFWQKISPHWRRRFIYASISFLVLSLCIVISAWMVPLPERLQEHPSSVIAFRDGSVGHVFLSNDERWRMPIDLQRIDPAFVAALIDLEDRRFYHHPGVDPVAIGRAALQNISSGRVISGGSTLTMQLARMLEPKPRVFSAKIVEAFRALQLELRLSKDEILAAYLQFAPYGKNIEGVESAAFAYFGHSAQNLSPSEICILLAVPQRPAERFPAMNHGQALKKARDRAAQRLAGSDYWQKYQQQKNHTTLQSNTEIVDTILQSEVPTTLQAFPRSLPHAATWLLAKYPGRGLLRTTLDAGVQRTAERLLSSQERHLSERLIHNASIVVVDHHSNEVVALVGNFDFFDETHGGQIASFDVPRSPGSALKPFIYAMAIDRGIALPTFLVADVPQSYGGYRPKNYDGQAQGLVRLETALSQSLNLPFVDLLSQIGVEQFIGSLRSLGAKSLSSKQGYYGLSAAIGAVELTPLDLTALYSALAEDGGYRPLRFIPKREGEKDTQALRVLSPGASHLTRQALRIRDRPDFPSRRQQTQAIPQIHWKTGTSYGHRDAWTAGSGPRYTASIWLGNLDQRPSVHLVASEVAAPIFFDLLESLGEGRQHDYQDRAPSDLKPVAVCSLSGHLPGHACDHTHLMTTLAPIETVPTAKCPYHIEADIDDETGLLLTPQCRSGHRYSSKTMVRWPARVQRFLQEQQRSLSTLPAYAEGCAPAEENDPPRIISPEENQTVILIPGMPPSSQEIPLEADSMGGNSISWFVDGEYIQTVSSSERIWWEPSIGDHKIVVVDEKGQSAQRKISVKEQ